MCLSRACGPRAAERGCEAARRVEAALAVGAGEGSGPGAGQACRKLTGAAFPTGFASPATQCPFSHSDSVMWWVGVGQWGYMYFRKTNKLFEMKGEAVEIQCLSVTFLCSSPE